MVTVLDLRKPRKRHVEIGLTSCHKFSQRIYDLCAKQYKKNETSQLL